MHDKIRKILVNSLKKKYKVSNATIDALTGELMQLLSNPVKSKGNAYVMTEAASRAADKKDYKNAKPTAM